MPEKERRSALARVSLKDARRKRDRAKELLANDIDPGAQKKCRQRRSASGGA